MSRFYFKQYQIAEQPKTKDEKPKIEEVEDSIALEDVHRTRTYTDGTMIILLKDGHEVTKEIQVMSKNGVPSTRNERVWVQSEIRLTPEDAKRFKYLTTELTWGELDAAQTFHIEPDQKVEESIIPDPINKENGIPESREEVEKDIEVEKNN